MVEGFFSNDSRVFFLKKFRYYITEVVKNIVFQPNFRCSLTNSGKIVLTMIFKKGNLFISLPELMKTLAIEKRPI